MDSVQNLVLLNNLYRLKALGFNYIDPITPNVPSAQNDISMNDLLSIKKNVDSCHLCDLSKSRKQSMFGFGSTTAKILIIDAFVSSAEDETNKYYVGKSGSMLQDMIENVLELSINDIYFTHAVKCKPFGFQTPSESECMSCSPYLKQQITLLNPSIIIALGADSYRLLTNDSSSFEDICGKVVTFGNSKLISLHHPSFLIRNPSLKKEAFQHLLTIKKLLTF